MKKLDVICLGRAAVDLYAEQQGTSLEDASSFKKYLGGSSANMAFGCARLGLKVGMLTRVGSDHMGRFVVDELKSVGVNTSMVQVDASRLTGLVLLGMRNENSFPLIFYRNNCADMAIQPTFTQQQIASAKVLVITGTHFSTSEMRAVCLKAIEYAKNSNVKVVVDVDYRPVLWGIGRLEDGESRFAESKKVTSSLQKLFSYCDVIVGTEEELHIGGGSTNTLRALKAVRQISKATIVLKRGALGCQVFTKEIPSKLNSVAIFGGVKVQVLNVLGAGDAFISGLLRGYIKKPTANNGEKEQSRNFNFEAENTIDWQRAANFANACGAIVVSRHSCAPAIPTKTELDYFIANRSAIPRPDKNTMLKHLHRTTTRHAIWNKLAILAFDHRAQFIEMATQQVPVAIEKMQKNKKIASALLSKTLQKNKTYITSATYELSEEILYSLIKHLKILIFKAFLSVTKSTKLKSKLRGKVGLLCDTTFGKNILASAASKGFWIAAPVEKPKKTPLEFEQENIGLEMQQWGQEIIAKCLVFVNNNKKQMQASYKKLLQLWHAVQVDERELLLELIVEDASSLTAAMEKIYALGIRPDWWKVSVTTSNEWNEISKIITINDSYCRGVLLLGLDGSLSEVAKNLNLAAQHSICKGFAVGRTFFGSACKKWLAGELSDEKLVKEVATNYEKLLKKFI